MSKKKKDQTDGIKEDPNTQDVSPEEPTETRPPDEPAPMDPPVVLDTDSPVDAAYEEEVAKPVKDNIDETPDPVSPSDETPNIAVPGEGAAARKAEQAGLGHMPTPDELASRLDCEVCQGTGAVPKTVIDGKTTEWKDCNACGGHPIDPRTGLRVNPMGLNNVR